MKKFLIALMAVFVLFTAFNSNFLFADISERQEEWFKLIDDEYMDEKGIADVKLDLGSYYGQNQCTQVAWHYCKFIFGVKFPPSIINGDAVNMFEEKVGFTGSNSTYFTRIYNDRNDPNQIPQRGDILIFNRNHVGIVSYADTDGFIMYDQNVDAPYNGFNKVMRETHYKYSLSGGVKGWLRPNPDLIIGAEKPVEDEKLPEEPSSEVFAICMTEDSTLNLRTEANLNSTVVFDIPYLANIKVRDNTILENNFYPVEYSGIKGWVSADWIKISTISDKEKCDKIVEAKIIKPSTGAGLDKSIKKAQAIALVIRIIGEEKEVLAMTEEERDEILSKVEDRDKISNWAKKYIAYSIKRNIIDGVPSENEDMKDMIVIDSKSVIHPKSIVIMLMRSLGYDDVNEDNVVEKLNLAGVESKTIEKLMEKDEIKRSWFGVLAYEFINSAKLPDETKLKATDRYLKDLLKEKEILPLDF